MATEDSYFLGRRLRGSFGPMINDSERAGPSAPVPDTNPGCGRTRSRWFRERAAAHVAAGGLASFGECMADEQPAEAVGPVCGLVLAQACAEQDRGQRFPQRERRLGDRGAGCRAAG